MSKEDKPLEFQDLHTNTEKLDLCRYIDAELFLLVQRASEKHEFSVRDITEILAVGMMKQDIKLYLRTGQATQRVKEWEGVLPDILKYLEEAPPFHEQ